MGAHEGVEKKDGRQGKDYSGRKRSFWKRGWGGGGGRDDAVGCAEDEDDVGEGKAGGGATVNEHTEAVWS